MMDTISHRGPDDFGIYINNNFGMGHRRLSIIDLNTGKQPIFNEDNTLAIVFNGEIYNYAELRELLISKGHHFTTKTDTEVILHLYEENGFDCLRNLRGMFSFAIFDSNRRKLFIARDRVGIKPLYYAIYDDYFIFGSEIKSILAGKDFPFEVNNEAIAKFLVYSFNPGLETQFKYVKKLPPGCYMVVENGGVKITEYWDLISHFQNQDKNINIILDELNEIIEEAVRLHMISDVPVGVLLSGGLDSTSVLYYAIKNNKNIQTFTVGFENQLFEDERIYAKLISDKYGIRNYQITITPKEFFESIPKYIWHMEELVFEPPAISLYLISKLASNYVKVLLSGEGGDEAFAGYETYRNISTLEFIKNIKILNVLLSVMLKIAGNRMKHCSTEFASFILNNNFEKYYFTRASFPNQYYFKNIMDLIKVGKIGYDDDMMQNLLKDVHDANMRTANMKSYVDRMLYIDTKYWLPDRLLIKADKMTMANSVELRVPLLDHMLLEYTASLIDKNKVKNLKSKYVFKKAMEGKIPSEVIHRKKAGFIIPYEKMLFTEYKNEVLGVISGRNTFISEIFDINKIKNELLGPWMKNGNYSKEIFSLYLVEMWHSIFSKK